MGARSLRSGRSRARPRSASGRARAHHEAVRHALPRRDQSLNDSHAERSLAMRRRATIAAAFLLACAWSQTPAPVTKDQVDRWMTEISNWGRWGKDDQRGTLNLITPEKRRQALRLVHDGVSVSLAHLLDKEKFPDNPRPLTQQMTLDSAGHALDLYTIWYHGSTITHIDALCQEIGRAHV